MGKPLFTAIHAAAGFTGVATGSAADVEGYDVPVGVLVGGTFVATVVVEVSYDAVTWVPFGAALTAPGTVKIDIPVKQVRARCTAFTSGTAVVWLGATNADGAF